MFALVLGMMFEDRRRSEKITEKAMLVVIAILIPFQLIATWAQGYVLLSPYLYLFSVYQHLQYVPVIVAGVYLFALYSLWDQAPWRRSIIVLTPAIGIYVATSIDQSAKRIFLRLLINLR